MHVCFYFSASLLSLGFGLDDIYLFYFFATVVCGRYKVFFFDFSQEGDRFLEV